MSTPPTSWVTADPLMIRNSALPLIGCVVLLSVYFQTASGVLGLPVSTTVVCVLPLKFSAALTI